MAETTGESPSVPIQLLQPMPPTSPMHETAALHVPPKWQETVRDFNAQLDRSLPGDNPSIYGLVGGFLLHRSRHPEGLVVRSVIYSAKNALRDGTGIAVSTESSVRGLYGEFHSFVAAREGQPHPLTDQHYKRIKVLTGTLRRVGVVNHVRLS